MDYIVTNSKTQNYHGLSPLSLAEMKDILSTAKILGVDTETTGLNFLDDTLLMLQIFDGTSNFVVDCRNVDISDLREIFVDKTVTKIFHNAKFDLKFLKANGLETENVYDTMLAEKVIHGGKKSLRFGLKFLMERYFNQTLDKDVRSTFIGHTGDFTKAQLVYGLEDTNRLIKIKELQEKQIEKLDLAKTVWLENNAVQVFADIEFNGLYLDKDAWDAQAEINHAKMVDLQNDLDEELLKNHPEYDSGQIDMFGEGRRSMINWGSPPQVLKLLRNYDSKLESTGGPALKELAKSFPFIKQYVQYKETAKAYNSYGPKFYEHLYSDGKVHTSFNQLLDTGRVSSQKPNMQQIPADNVYRNAFVPKDSDWVFVSSDLGFWYFTFLIR